MNPDRGDLQVGDTFTAIVTDLNADSSRDPVTKVDGTVCFLTFPEGIEPEWGKTYRARIVDRSETVYNAVVVERDNGGDGS